MQVVVELIDHLAWLEPTAIGGEPLHELGKEPQQGEVLVDDVGHAGSQHLDGHLPAALEPGEVHLRNRGTGHRCGLKGFKEVVDGLAKGRLDRGDGELGVEGGHLVLEQREFIRDVGCEQVATRREDLTEFDEDRAQALQGLTDAAAAALVEPPAKSQHGQQNAQQARIKPTLRTIDGELIEPVAPDHQQDGEHPKQGGHGVGRPRSWKGKRLRSSRCEGTTRPRAWNMDSMRPGCWRCQSCSMRLIC